MYAKQLHYMVDIVSEPNPDTGFFENKVIPYVQEWLKQKEKRNVEGVKGRHCPDLCYFAEVVSSRGDLYKVFSKRMLKDVVDFPYVKQSFICIAGPHKTEQIKKPVIKFETAVIYKEDNDFVFELEKKAKGDLIGSSGLVAVDDGFCEIEVKKVSKKKYILLLNEDEKVDVNFLGKEIKVSYLTQISR